MQRQISILRLFVFWYFLYYLKSKFGCFLLFFGRGGEVILCGMEFNLIEFTLAPSVEVFNCCRKKDLLLIANLFNISV